MLECDKKKKISYEEQRGRDVDEASEYERESGRGEVNGEGVRRC